ncbi:aldo/keto reductase [Paractinoplanes brasiliensis]|uniref:Aryl-alcohol dehydrogenase-like predicted oxidoreductase n=1 Tax=Paractinoplanes brasiliensis TaxID=52695 RepID=A0A4R6JZW4_9ACTN|nr:aldo/keto reductase [Actinoplanes brasiliensis]TDO42473.1 aryl-alcohol dehydrogenase-like predicted oxidoreductase [Actinoplanes brasiliensis]GID29709.1 aldo/keto reductase [Actinoplanes brasiliensis]
MTDEYGKLGDHRVRRVGFGAMQLEHGDREDAVKILRQAVELGVDHIDTAQFYGDGRVNELIRTALHPYGNDLRLVSKVGAVSHPVERLVLAQKPAQLRAGVEENLRTLGIDRIPVVNLRRADMQPGIIAGGDQVVDLDSQLAELIALREEGKIGAIGLSHVSLPQLRQALPAGIVCVQNLYNVLTRDHEDVLQECAARGVAWVPYFPLGSAFDQIPTVTDHPVVVAQARRLGITPAQVGLAWLLGHSPATLLIPGTRSLDHLTENMAVAAIELDSEATAALDALASPGPDDHTVPPAT